MNEEKINGKVIWNEVKDPGILQVTAEKLLLDAAYQEKIAEAVALCSGTKETPFGAGILQCRCVADGIQ